MSFNKQKISHFINSLYAALTADIKELVDKNATHEIRFIYNKEEVRSRGGNFHFQELKDSSLLKEVCLIDIALDEESIFCFLDKWDESATNDLQKAGLKNTNASVDGIIFYYNQTQKELSIYLIELKSTLDDKKIEHCMEKFEQTISRLSVFVPIISYVNNINFEEVRVKFKAVICFSNRGNVSQVIDVPENLTDIYRAYHNKRIDYFGKGSVRVKKTLFTFDNEGEKIDVRFIGFQDRNENKIFESESKNDRIYIKFENFLF